MAELAPTPLTFSGATCESAAEVTVVALGPNHRGLLAVAGMDPQTWGANSRFEYLLLTNEAFRRRERDRARQLRATAWWDRKLAAGVCHYCGARVGREQLTLDHIVPISQGGTSTRGNCVPACRACNASKRDQTPVEMLLGRRDD